MRRQATRRKTFLPVPTLGTRGAVEVDGVRVDGRPVTALPRDAELDLRAYAECGSFELDLSVGLPDELPTLFPPDEPVDLRVVAVVEDDATWYRAPTRLAPSVTGRHAGTVRIERAAIGRGFEVRASVCRGAAGQDPRWPTEVGARLCETPPLRVVLEEPPEVRGGLLDIQWARFSERHPEAEGAAHFLELTGARPTLWLNAEIDGLRAVLVASGRTGPRARLRELLFRSMADQVWTELFHAASAGFHRDDDGELRFAEPWHEPILRVVADHSFSGPRPARWGTLVEALEADGPTAWLLERVATGRSRWLGSGAAIAAVVGVEE